MEKNHKNLLLMNGEKFEDDPKAKKVFNNKIRWLVKQAYGYRNYKYFRIDVLVSHEHYGFDVHLHKL